MTLNQPWRGLRRLAWPSTIQYIVLMAAALLLYGCASAPVTPLQPMGSAIAKAEAYIDAAKPHADSEGKGLLDKATNETGNAGKQIDGAAKQLGALQAENVAQATKLEAYSHRWVGDATWRAVRWIIAGYLALQAAAILLGGLMPGGIGGSIARMVFNVLPFSNPFVAVARKISSGAFLPAVKAIVAKKK